MPVNKHHLSQLDDDYVTIIPDLLTNKFVLQQKVPPILVEAVPIVKKLAIPLAIKKVFIPPVLPQQPELPPRRVLPLVVSPRPALPPRPVAPPPPPAPRRVLPLVIPPRPTLPSTRVPAPRPVPPPQPILAPRPTLPPRPAPPPPPAPASAPAPQPLLAPRPAAPPVPEEVSVERKPLRSITLLKQEVQEPEQISINTLTYNIPTRNDIAVLLVFFDYVGSVRILMNYLFMREKLKLANIPVFTLELVMKGSKPKISDAIHVYGSSYLFQKEHLLRLLEKQIPEKFTKLACLDADVLFNDSKWYDKLSILLDTSQVVQCFENAIWLDITYTKIQKTATSCLKVPSGKRLFGKGHTKNYHPGFGWAFNRKWYNKSGFYDLSIIGSGDTMFAYGIMKYPTENNYETRIYEKSYNHWKTTTNNPQVSFLPLTLYHLYHGPIANRQYVSRYSYFEKYQQIEECIAGKNADDIYELKDSSVNANMLTFFKTRNDDEID